MKEVNGGKQMKDVWTGSLTKSTEKKEGKHPTQKPEYLLERIVLASTAEGMLVMDPFCGSGTTGVGSQKAGQKIHRAGDEGGVPGNQQEAFGEN